MGAEWPRRDRSTPRLRGRTSASRNSTPPGVRPIAGLLHHGSGPPHTDLADPAFPRQFTSFARIVAERYPWITEWTPINEPVTTARFSGLYGHWYPHARSDAAFVRMVLNQVRAIAEAMATIRSVIPGGEAPAHRRRGHDLRHAIPRRARRNSRTIVATSPSTCCSGESTSDHPLWKYLRASGASREELDWFRAHPCPPDTIGANYYVTSDRFLDRPGRTVSTRDARRQRTAGVRGHRRGSRLAATLVRLCFNPRALLVAIRTSGGPHGSSHGLHARGATAVARRSVESGCTRLPRMARRSGPCVSGHC